MTNGSFIRTDKKRQKYYSKVTLVLLHYSNTLKTLTSRGLGATDLLHPSQTDRTGCDCYAQPNWHCRFLEPFLVCVVKEVFSR